MFLNAMATDEKEKFIELAYKMSQIDGDYAEEEERIINSYKAELGIGEIGDSGSVSDLIEYFGTREMEVKKLVLFELYGLICADNKIEKSEEEYFERIKKTFGIQDDLVKQITDVADELLAIYDKIYDILA